MQTATRRAADGECYGTEYKTYVPGLMVRARGVGQLLLALAPRDVLAAAGPVDELHAQVAVLGLGVGCEIE